MNRLVAEADITLADAEALVGPVCEHLAEHGADVARDGAAWVLTWPQGQARLLARSGRLSARAEANNGEALYLLKFGIASHVMEFAGQPALAISWSGDGRELTTPPNYRAATVAAVADVTPHLRRVTFAGDDLARFMTDDALHVKLVLPTRRGGTVAPPTIGPDGLVTWPRDGGEPSALRTYTIRRYDRVAGTIDVDFVLHDDPGPGAGWAMRAAPGEAVGVMGPGGGGVPGAERLLLAGDETALPAIARILETVSPAVRGVALVEISGAAEEQRLARPEGVELVWLRRDRTDPPLAAAVASIAFPDGATSRFLWSGSEFENFRQIRAHARKTLALGKAEHLVVAYWRKDQTEEAPS